MPRYFGYWKNPTRIDNHRQCCTREEENNETEGGARYNCQERTKAEFHRGGGASYHARGWEEYTCHQREIHPDNNEVLYLNLYVIYLLFRTNDDVDVEYITILLILLFRLHFCRTVLVSTAIVSYTLIK